MGGEQVQNVGTNTVAHSHTEEARSRPRRGRAMEWRVALRSTEHSDLTKARIMIGIVLPLQGMCGQRLGSPAGTGRKKPNSMGSSTAVH